MSCFNTKLRLEPYYVKALTNNKIILYTSINSVAQVVPQVHFINNHSTISKLYT